MAWIVKELVYKILHPVTNRLVLKSKTLSPSSPGTSQDFTILAPPSGHVLVVDRLFIYNPSTTDTATVAVKDGDNVIAGPVKVRPGETVELSSEDIPQIINSLVISTDYDVHVSGMVMVV